MEKSEEGKDIKIRKVKAGMSHEQDEILNRTLEKRLPTGG